jgi:hypothetical protein
MLEPKSIEIKTQAGVTRTYMLSKFPAVAGREIVAKYPLSGMPKLGDYAVNEETMLKLMGFVGAVPPSGGDPIPLTTRALVDNHVPDWETLARIEIAMMEYNVSFFGNGRASGFFEGIAQKLPASLTKILTDSLRQLSEKNKPHSTN